MGTIDSTERSYEFTMKAINSVYNTVDDARFEKAGAELIFQTISNWSNSIGFSNILKRYIYKKANLSGHFEEIPLATYRGVIADHFRESGTPFSFFHTTTRPSTIINTWLTKGHVARDAAILLGFGLRMDVTSVNELLVSGNHECELDPDDVFEGTFIECLENKYSYSKFRDLLSARGFDFSQYSYVKHEKKTVYQHKEDSTRDDECYEAFKFLCSSIVDYINQNRKQLDLPHDTNPVSAYTITKILYSSIPTDRYGNALPDRLCNLPEVYLGRRLERRRLHCLLSRENQPDRYDFITLMFLKAALQRTSPEETRRSFLQFLDDTNALLTSLDMGEIYPPDPYESLLLMCMMTADPIDTFAEVLEYAWSDVHGSGRSEGTMA